MLKLSNFKKNFLKAALNKLVLYYFKVNYKIKLLNNLKKIIAVLLLYYIFLKQLKLVKTYLKKHFKKSFIIFSLAFYSLLILFIKKLKKNKKFALTIKSLILLYKKTNTLFFLLIKLLQS